MLSINMTVWEQENRCNNTEIGFDINENAVVSVE